MSESTNLLSASLSKHYRNTLQKANEFYKHSLLFSFFDLEAAVRKCCSKLVFLKINSQEFTIFTGKHLFGVFFK